MIVLSNLCCLKSDKRDFVENLSIRRLSRQLSFVLRKTFAERLALGAQRKQNIFPQGIHFRFMSLLNQAPLLQLAQG